MRAQVPVKSNRVPVQCVDMVYIHVHVQRGYSALMWAATWGMTEVVKELVEAGADLNLQDNVCNVYVDEYCVHCIFYVLTNCDSLHSIATMYT